MNFPVECSLTFTTKGVVMPWKGKTIMQTRQEFIEQVLKGEKKKAALCREYCISRPTGDKWLKRWAEGVPNLEDRSHQAFHLQNKLDPIVEQAIVDYRMKFPKLGAKKIHAILLKEGDIEVPCVKTINNVLKRNGLITPEASKAATPYVRFVKDAPNDMWQADFKGWFTIRDGIECHTLNILDDHSRFCVRSVPLPGETLDLVLPVFLDAFEEYGLPFSLLCDNGNPWGTGAVEGFTKFEVHMMELGVLVIHGRKFHPQTQGKMERFNRTETSECFKLPQYNFSQYGFNEVKDRIRSFLNFYNYNRPHEALSMDAPIEHFHHSNRKYIRNAPISEWDYPDGFTTRSVSKRGYFSFRGADLFFSEAFSGKHIAWRDSHRPNCITIFFREFKLARYNYLTGEYERRGIQLIDNDPRSIRQTENK